MYFLPLYAHRPFEYQPHVGGGGAPGGEGPAAGGDGSAPGGGRSAPPAPTTSTAPDPQPSTSTAPDPQPSTSAAPDPQPSTSTAPDPQPSTSAAPDPQPSTSKAADPQPSTSAAPDPQPFSGATPLPHYQNQPVQLYIKSPSCSPAAATALHDTIQLVKRRIPVATVAMGEVGGLSTLLLACGTRGFRYAYRSTTLTLGLEGHDIEFFHVSILLMFK